MMILWHKTLKGKAPDFPNNAGIFGFFSSAKVFISISLHWILYSCCFFNHWMSSLFILSSSREGWPIIDARAYVCWRWFWVQSWVSKLPEIPWISPPLDFLASQESSRNCQSFHFIAWSSYWALYKCSISLFFCTSKPSATSRIGTLEVINYCLNHATHPSNHFEITLEFWWHNS